MNPDDRPRSDVDRAQAKEDSGDRASKGAPWPPIVADKGSLGGGASSVQRVVIRRVDGSEVDAYSKFAQDTSGGNVAEAGVQGVCSELIASELAALIGAPTPRIIVVDLPKSVAITLRDQRHPRPGLAVASEEIVGLAEVSSRDQLAVLQSVNDLALIRVFHLWIEVQDRGHNLGLAGGAVYSLDHATAMRSSWAGADAGGADVPDHLMDGIFDEDPEALEEAALVLKQVTDAQIDDVYDQVPEAFMQPPLKDLFKANTKKLRDLTVSRVLREVDELRGRGSSHDAREVE